MTSTITIYTDGSSLNNGSPNAKGGWSAVFSNGRTQRLLSGRQDGATNQQMEMTAVIEALSAIKKPQATIDLYSDSSYVIQGCNEWLEGWKAKGWKNANKKPVKNKELWIALDEQLQRLPNLTLHWVKGHSDDSMNDLADKLAVDAAKGRCVDERKKLN